MNMLLNANSYRQAARRSQTRQLGHAVAACVDSLERRLFLTASMTPAVDHDIGSSADFIDSADFNADGHRDLVVSSYSGSYLSILKGVGDGTFQTRTDLLLSDAPDFVCAADVNNDSKPDLIAVSYDAGTVSVLLGNGDATFQDPVSYSGGSSPRSVVVGDFTGDGKPDLAVAQSFAKKLVLLKNNGSGAFLAPTSVTVAFTPVDYVAGDFNNDGTLDLAAADFNTSKVAITLGNGDGTFQTATLYSTGSGPASVAAGDFNGDGKLDIATANFFGSSLSILRGNGNGTLQAASSLTAGSGATYVFVADIDGNGSKDLASADANSDRISLFFNNGSGTFSSASAYTVGNSPRSLVVANFDSGGLDIAVANQGDTTVSVLIGDGAAYPPTSNAGDSYTVNEGDTVQLSGLASTGSDLTYLWDLDGDGTYGESGSSAKRGDEVGATPVFSAVGLDGSDSRTVRLRVTDANGLSDLSSVVVWIQNVAPTLTIGGSSSIAEGSSFTLSLSSSDPGVDTISSWTINWGNGSTQVVSGNPASVTKTFTDNGNYTITATATDEDGTYSSNSKSITVSNVAPTLTLSGAAVLAVGGTYTLDLSSSDPGNDTISSWTINWGNGTSSVVGNVASATKTYSTVGTYSITATATDEDGTFNASGVSLAVRNPPGADAGGPYFVNEGLTTTLSAAGSSGSGLSYSWDLDGDGIYGESGAAAKRGDEIGMTPSFSAVTIDGPDSRTARVRVTDSYGLTDTASATVWIQNVAPTLTISGPGGVVVGGTYTLQMGSSDVGSDTLSSWTIDWGDGNTSIIDDGSSSASKTFTIAGTYTIAASATDEDGSYDANTITITVSDIPDTTSPTATLGTAAAVKTGGGQIYTFSVNYADNIAIDELTLDANDLRVSGPNGFNQLATLVSVANGPGTKRIATYRITAPGGSWDWSDNGSYTLALAGSQVADTSGNYLAAKTIGTFSTAIIPPDTAGNDTLTARNLSSLGSGSVKVAADVVGSLDKNDFFKIKLAAQMDLAAKLSSLSDRADLWLYSGNGVAVASSRRGGASDEILNRRLSAGTYFVRVVYTGSAAGTSFRLRLAATAPPVDPGTASASDRGALPNGAVSSTTGSLNATDAFDYFKFSLKSSASVYLKLSGLTDNADLQILSSTGQSLASSSHGDTSDESIRQTLAAGVYYVRVSLMGTIGTIYKLRFANETA